LPPGKLHSHDDVIFQGFARQIESPLAPTAAEEAFADADYGVDPMVTGPTSVAFERRQADLGCEQAVWPNIPLACYPD
jgi:hypothetical protein